MHQNIKQNNLHRVYALFSIYYSLRIMTKMKTLSKKLFGILAIALMASFTFTSCDEDDPIIMGPDSIVAIASETPSLSTLEAALLKFPNLVSALGDENGTYTVFAPTNTAFTALLAAVGQTDLDDVPEDVLERILRYHVIQGAALASTDLSDGQMAETILTGESITVGINGSTVTIDDAEVTIPNVEASNGIIHIVDAVLVPSLEASIVNTVVEPAYFNKNFTILTEAVVTAGLLNTLIDPAANFTVFAPTNDAFAAAGITTLSGLTAADLTPILQYHVLSTEVKEADLPATGSAVPTLNGDFYLSINTNGVFINGSTQVTATDIDQNNGVVHVINRTLTPSTSNIVEIAVAAASADPDAEFTQLVAALLAVEADGSTDALVTILSSSESPAPFTVFAPTDAAFATLYSEAGVANLTELIDAVGIGTLEAVLKYHVVGSARVFSTDLPNLGSNTITTLGGTFTVDLGTLEITETDNALMLDMDDTAAIIGTDILGTNGVIHTIDKVILP